MRRRLWRFQSGFLARSLFRKEKCPQIESVGPLVSPWALSTCLGHPRKSQPFWFHPRMPDSTHFIFRPRPCATTRNLGSARALSRGLGTLGMFLTLEEDQQS